jgi:type IV secretory pathway VirB4 component
MAGILVVAEKVKINSFFLACLPENIVYYVESEFLPVKYFLI